MKLSISILRILLLICLVSGFIKTNNAYNYDISKVGVHNGDLFTYKLIQHSLNLEDEYFVEKDKDTEKEVRIERGEIFQLKVIDSIPKSEGMGGYFILAEYTHDDIIIQAKVHLDHDLIIFSDWTYWENFLRKELIRAKVSGDVTNYEIINGEEEFIINVFTNLTENMADGSIRLVQFSTELRYDKVSGTLNLDYFSGYIYSGGFNNTFLSHLEKISSFCSFTPSSHTTENKLVLSQYPLIVAILMGTLFRKRI